MKEKKVLVTGATGFVGRYLVRLLLNNGASVWIISRRRAQETGFDNRVNIFYGDICQEIILPAGIETVYHCAGVIYDESRMCEVNVEGTRRVVEAALQHNCRLIHLSSAGVTGESNLPVMDETVVCRPGNIYEKSKHEAEQVVLEGISRGLQAQILRPTIIFGNGRDPERDSFLQLIQAMLTGKYRQVGKGIYNVVHVEEVVRAMHILDNDGLDNGGIFNINTPITFSEMFNIVTVARDQQRNQPTRVPYSAAWLAAIILTGLSVVTGKPAPLTLSRLKALTNTTVYSQQHFEDELQYAPLFSVEEYILRTVAEYKSNGLLA